jgi:hypothetical protein
MHGTFAVQYTTSSSLLAKKEKLYSALQISDRMPNLLLMQSFLVGVIMNHLCVFDTIEICRSSPCVAIEGPYISKALVF